jgi:FAD/FMN-containing dehydrogenase
MAGGNISRRDFLAAGTLAVLGAGIAGCASTTSKPKAPTAPHQPTAPPSAAAPTSAEWRALGGALDGTLVLPPDSGYASARLVYDLRFEGAAPQAIAYCASATDVQRSIDFARSHEVQPIPRCGGHSYGGYSTGSGLIVDVSPMNQVAIAGATATVGAGARLIDLYAAGASAGVLVPGGSCPTVGVAGLALGGGIGVVGRRYGLTCDQIESLTAVTADGRIVSVSPESEPDLYWASRGGGGGNFAVVTEFALTAYPIPPLTLFDLDFPWAAAGELLGAWQDWVADAPDELWTNCLLLAGGGARTAKAAGVFAGSQSDLAPLLAALISAVGTAPTSQYSVPNDYLTAMLAEAGCPDLSVAQCHLPSGNPAGRLQRTALIAKSQYVATQFPSAALSVAADAVESFQSALPAFGGGLAFDSYGGAINAVAPDATAFVHRNALCQIQLSAAGAFDATSTATAQSWLEQTAAALAPYCDGQAYQNYIDPTLGDWQQAYYGANLPRLVEIKRAYDPDDVFHFAQSIPTTLTS